MSRGDFPGPVLAGPGRSFALFLPSVLRLNPERGDHRIMVTHL